MNRHRILVVAAATLSAALWGPLACGDGGTEPPPPDPPRPTTVTVTPATAELTALGATVQLSAQVLDQYGQVMAGAAVSWSSSAASVATVDGSGLVTGAGNGAATITATAGSASGTAAVTVAQQVSTVEVSPAADTVVERDTVRFDAEARDANGHAVAGAAFTWASGDTSVATVDASGLVTGTGEGEVEVAATSSGVTGRAELVVEALVPTTVSVAPSTLAFTALGDTVRLMAEVRDQIDRVMEGEPVAWTSAETMVAAVDSTGLVTAVANGAATITAMAGSASGTAAVTVAQQVSTVEVSPAADTVVERDTVRFDAEARDANGHAVAAAEFTWASGDTSVATVDASGLVTGTGAGEVEVAATSSGVTGRAQLTVVAPAPTAIAVTPDTVALTALGQTVQLAAEVLDQAGRVMEGEPVSWTSADTMVATVDGSGLVGAAANGTATITATAGSASGEAVVTVMQSAGSVVVSPAAATIALGDTVRLAAEVFDENGHLVAGAEFSWASSDVSVATVDASGLVRGAGEGTATITATAGDARGTSEITVENPDRAALVALYEATDGPNWVSNEGWLTDAPLGEWYGVDTNGPGRVIRLDLGGRWDSEAQVDIPHGLTGPIPPELGSLADLTSLSLGGNQLSGPIPPELGSLANLTGLNLEFNELTGPIPPELGKLVNLRWLGLGKNNLTGPIPPELGSLANLTGLNLWRNQLSGPIPPELDNLANLTSLRLSRNALTGPIPPELGSLADLTSLSLGGNQLTGPIPPELGNLARLQRLFLEANNLTGSIPPELGQISSLTVLSLWHNRLTGPIPAELGNLSSLTHLSLGNNGLTGPIPAELGSLSSLTSMSLWDNALTGSIPPELGNLSELTSMVISANHLSGPIPAELGKLTDLTALHLNENSLSGPMPTEIGELTNLTLLHLFDNSHLAGPLPPSLTALTTLESLRFYDTALCVPQTTEFQLWLRGIASVHGENCPIVQEGDREALAAIYKWTNGDGWRSNANWLGDAPLDDWHGVTADNTDRVTALDLSDNNLAGIVPTETGRLLYLKDLVLSDNTALGGDLPGSMLQMTSLSTLRVGRHGAMPAWG